MAHKATSLKSKTKSWLVRRGWLVLNTENFVYMPKHPLNGVRQDLAGCIDLMGLHPDCFGILWVQACAVSGVSTHAKKAMAGPVSQPWLELGLRRHNRFLIFGWEPGHRGPKRIVELFLYKGELISQDSSL